MADLVVIPRHKYLVLVRERAEPPQEVLRLRPRPPVPVVAYRARNMRRSGPCSAPLYHILR